MLEVVVVDDSGLSIPVALVQGPALPGGTTDADGRIRWESLPPGTYAFEVLRQGFQRARGQAVIGETGAALEVTLDVTGGDMVMGMVVVENIDEHPLKGLRAGPGMLGKVPR